MRYLIIIKLAPDPQEPNRQRAHLPQLVEVVNRFSDNENTLAFKGDGGMIFGYYFKTKKDIATLAPILTGHQAFRRGDALMITEVGDLISGHGMSSIWTWLQHHK